MRNIERSREKEKDVTAARGERRRTARVSREGAGDDRRRMYIKILFSDEIPGGARRHTQRARVYF